MRKGWNKDSRLDTFLVGRLDRFGDDGGGVTTVHTGSEVYKISTGISTLQIHHHSTVANLRVPSHLLSHYLYLQTMIETHWIGRLGQTSRGRFAVKRL